MSKRLNEAERDARLRLLLIERRDLRRQEFREVGEGVAETVALGEGRGEAFAKPKPGVRARPVRRLSGLAWLASKGRLNAAQMAVGLAYGEAYREAEPPSGVRSTLDDTVGGGSGLDLARLHAAARRRVVAEARLARMRGRLCGQADLVNACDVVCGRELTPREASANGDHAGRLEAVLLVALDLLSAPVKAAA